MKSFKKMGLILLGLTLSLGSLSGCSESDELTQDDLLQIYTDYLLEETSASEITCVRFLGFNGQVIGPSEAFLRKLGQSNLVREEGNYRGMLTLSPVWRANTKKYELRAIDDGIVWFYPLFKNGDQWAIELEGTGRIINLEIHEDGTMTFYGEEIGISAIRTLARNSGRELRVVLIVKGSLTAESEFLNRIEQEIHAGAADATVKFAKRNRDGEPS